MVMMMLELVLEVDRQKRYDWESNLTSASMVYLDCWLFDENSSRVKV